MDLDNIEWKAETAITRLEFANEVAGGSRVGTDMAIEVLKQIPDMIELIKDLKSELENEYERGCTCFT